jgi:hypothetical protein
MRMLLCQAFVIPFNETLSGMIRMYRGSQKFVRYYIHACTFQPQSLLAYQCNNGEELGICDGIFFESMILLGTIVLACGLYNGNASV